MRETRGRQLGLIQRALSWLRPSGLFVANLDLTNIRLEGGKPAARLVGAAFRASGLQWNARTRIVRAIGPASLDAGLEVVGADDGAGPNDARQPAVDSHDRRGVDEGGPLP